MNTIVSSAVYTKCLEHFRDIRGRDCVVPDSLPITFFGDVSDYSKSDIRIVTAALNPSGIEFPENGPRRFNVKLGLSGPQGLEETLSKYFHKNPYSKWFSSFETVLNGMGATYGGKMQKAPATRTALHVDLCSPIATTPTWSALPQSERRRLTKAGREIFEALIVDLAPDIVIASVAWDHITSWMVQFQDGRSWPSLITYEHTVAGEAFRSPLKVQAKRISLGDCRDVLFINGSAANTPFGRFSSERKREVGKYILRHFQMISRSFL